MSTYITPDGRRQVDPGDLTHTQRRNLRRLAQPRAAKQATPKPCGCAGDTYCPQHVQALPRRQRVAAQRAASCAAGEHSRNCPRDSCPAKAGRQP